MKMQFLLQNRQRPTLIHVITKYLINITNYERMFDRDTSRSPSHCSAITLNDMKSKFHLGLHPKSETVNVSFLIRSTKVGVLQSVLFDKCAVGDGWAIDVSSPITSLFKSNYSANSNYCNSDNEENEAFKLLESLQPSTDSDV